MMLRVYQCMNTLGQMMPRQPWEEQQDTAKTVEPARPLSFGDLQKSMHSQLSGQNNDNFYRNALLGIVIGIAVLALFLHWRQRRRNGGPLNSVRKLGWELSRSVRFPFGTRVLLWWVARSTRVPVAVLLISGEVFEASVSRWSKEPTFGVVREWGSARLLKLQGVLFDAEISSAPI